MRLFASLIEDDQWANPLIEQAEPNRQPLPKPDLRHLLRPLGPVAVFGPANFPLAYTVGGGDTASALAAGCPVIVKAHPSHPGTSEVIAHAIVAAARSCGLPAGVFSVLFDAGHDVGTALVQHPAIRAVGFTGSKAGGRQVLSLCQNRPTPIPMFGELSSLNPVCLLPAALTAAPEQIAAGLHGSVTLGCGQFCTNPGAIFYINSPAAERFVDELITQLRRTPPAPMLNAGIRQAYGAGTAALSRASGVETLLAASEDTGPGGTHAAPALFRCEAATFANNTTLHEEVFGPCTLLIACRDLSDMTRAVSALGGQLTASVHATDADLAEADALLWALEDRAGRLIFNGWPTGVEVCPAMVHGGPWPATTDARFTSVGTGAIRRWLRPICWQNAPAAALPPALRS